ncbi:fatty acid desaturase family protein [Ilumatobacter sp.]|uniref:fatty acid desaturase family protein n=1 Tax=Ilumatobacter sp. TaxID=1967498 RepID=UPI003B51D64D
MTAATAPTARTLVPTADDLPDVLPTDRLNSRGMATRAWRPELRRIADVRNVATVAWALLLTFGVVALAGVLHTWWAYLVAFVLMGAGHARLNILGHEAAHRLLFSDRRANDLVGRWLLAYPSFQAMLAYRRSHFAHHRDELGPEEPDLALYSGYPVPPDSWRRKLTRDAIGISAYKNFLGLYRAVRSGAREARQILAVHVVLLGASIVVMRPLTYVVWVLSWSTLWRVSNRLRSIAEHGGMVRSKDRRLTTHVVEQSPLARSFMVPYNTGYHLAHHVDMGVPWRNLPRLHAELVESGWVVPDIVHPDYPSFWRAASSGHAELPDAPGAGSGRSSTLSV